MRVRARRRRTTKFLWCAPRSCRHARPRASPPPPAATEARPPATPPHEQGGEPMQAESAKNARRRSPAADAGSPAGAQARVRKIELPLPPPSIPPSPPSSTHSSTFSSVSTSLNSTPTKAPADASSTRSPEELRAPSMVPRAAAATVSRAAREPAGDQRRCKICRRLFPDLVATGGRGRLCSECVGTHFTSYAQLVSVLQEDLRLPARMQTTGGRSVMMRVCALSTHACLQVLEALRSLGRSSKAGGV